MDRLDTFYYGLIEGRKLAGVRCRRSRNGQVDHDYPVLRRRAETITTSARARHHGSATDGPTFRSSSCKPISCDRCAALAERMQKCRRVERQHHFDDTQSEHRIEQHRQNSDHEQRAPVSQLVTHLSVKNQFDVFPVHTEVSGDKAASVSNSRPEAENWQPAEFYVVD